MSMQRDITYTTAYAEIRRGEQAKEIGNIGKARVCARRGCGLAIEYWLTYYPYKDWGSSAMSKLVKLQEDQTIPVEIRDAAERLTKKVNLNYETGINEDPIKDGEVIIKYFLEVKNLM